MPKWSSDLNHLAYADDTLIFVSAICVNNKLQACKGNIIFYGGKVVLIANEPEYANSSPFNYKPTQ
ncbi:hypothetical protein H5410_046933, partial [Solanum commersonii]